MTPAEKYEAMIRNARQTTDATTDRRILAHAEAALDKRYQELPARIRLSGLIRRVTVNSNRHKLATAAAIAAAVLLGLYALTGSVDGTSVTLAQVRQAMDGINWMKIINEGETVGDGRAEIDWFSFAARIHIHIDGEGRILYRDFANHRQFHWSPNGVSISESPLDEDSVFAYGAAGPFEMMDKSLRLIQAEHDADITRAPSTYRDQEVELWTIRWDAGAGRTLKIYFDTSKQLPVAATFDYGQPGGASRRESNIEFEYPETGPADIHEAGVPASVPIIAASEQ